MYDNCMSVCYSSVCEWRLEKRDVWIQAAADNQLSMAWGCLRVCPLTPKHIYCRNQREWANEQIALFEMFGSCLLNFLTDQWSVVLRSVSWLIISVPVFMLNRLARIWHTHSLAVEVTHLFVTFTMWNNSNQSNVVFCSSLNIHVKWNVRDQKRCIHAFFSVIIYNRGVELFVGLFQVV